MDQDLVTLARRAILELTEGFPRARYRLATCPACNGRGLVDPRCPVCHDSATTSRGLPYDHACPAPVTCNRCKGLGYLAAVKELLNLLEIT